MLRGRKLKKLYRKRLKGGWRSHLHSGAAPFHGNVFPVSELSWLRSCRKKKKVQLILSTAGKNPGLCEKLLSSQRLQKSTEERTDKKLHGDASNSSSACYRGKVFSNHREDCFTQTKLTLLQFFITFQLYKQQNTTQFSRPGMLSHRKVFSHK